MKPRFQKQVNHPREGLPWLVSGAQLVPLATAAVLSAWLLSQSFPPEMASGGLLLLVVVSLTLLFRAPLIPALLFLTQAVVAVSDGGSLYSTLTLQDQVIAGCLLALLLSLQRYLQIPEPPRLCDLRKQIAGQLNLLHWLSTLRRSRSFESPTFRSSAGGAEFLFLAVRVIASVVLTASLLALIPHDPHAPDDVALIPTAHRAIKLGLVFCVGIIVVNTVFNAISWRRLSPRAARLFLESQMTQWCGSEIRTILRLQDKRKRRRL
jgi:hypothetical protein